MVIVSPLQRSVGIVLIRLFMLHPFNAICNECVFNSIDMVGMSLKPRRVDFGTTWTQLLETVQEVITCGRIARSTWNDRFSYPYNAGFYSCVRVLSLCLIDIIMPHRYHYGS